MDGPLRSNPSGGAGFIEARPGKPVTTMALAIALHVSGDDPIVVDDVRLLPFSGVPLPDVLRARIDDAEAVGHRVAPEDDEPAPHLVLTVVTNERIAFNRLVQVSYHLLDQSTNYVALFDIHWMMCLKDRVTARQCDAAYRAALNDPAANSAE